MRDVRVTTILLDREVDESQINEAVESVVSDRGADKFGRTDDPPLYYYQWKEHIDVPHLAGLWEEHPPSKEQVRTVVCFTERLKPSQIMVLTTDRASTVASAIAGNFASEGARLASMKDNYEGFLAQIKAGLRRYRAIFKEDPRNDMRLEGFSLVRPGDPALQLVLASQISPKTSSDPFDKLFRAIEWGPGQQSNISSWQCKAVFGRWTQIAFNLYDTGVIVMRGPDDLAGLCRGVCRITSLLPRD
jgi:hypothetical protein